MKLLVCSLPDPASVNIRDRLLERGGWKEGKEFDGSPSFIRQDCLMISLKELHLWADNVDRRVESYLDVKVDSVVFLSRHRAVSGTHSLTVHPIGNYGKADFGGKAGTLVPPCPDLMTELLRQLKREAFQLDFEVAFEVTHHGPYLETPTLFIEIGSSEETWGSLPAARAIASSLLSVDVPNFPKVIGIGGGHYAPRYTELALKKKVSFGHMVPNYAFDLKNEDGARESVRKALEKTGTSQAYVHKKSMKRSEVTKLTRILKEMGAEVVDSSELEDLE